MSEEKPANWTRQMVAFLIALGMFGGFYALDTYVGKDDQIWFLVGAVLLMCLLATGGIVIGYLSDRFKRAG